MSTFYEIAGAVLPPLVGCALAAFSVAIIVASLRGLADVFLESSRIRDALAAIRLMRDRSRALYFGACRPTAGRFTLAVELWEFANRLDEALGYQPPAPPWSGSGPVAGFGPCHDGREGER